MTLGVAALVLVVFCGAIGFAIGRATAPKHATVSLPFATSPYATSPYTYRTIPRYAYPSYTYPTYTGGTQPRYGEDPSGNTYTEAGVFTITFPGHHNYPVASSFSAAGTYTRGHIVQSAVTASPRGLYLQWSDPLPITTTSQSAATMCTNRGARVENPGPSTVANRAGYTCRLAYQAYNSSSGNGTAYIDFAYLVANNRVFVFQASESSGATYAQFLAFVASFRLL